MKILYLITQGELGGAQRYVYDLAMNLPDNFEVVVAMGKERIELSQKIRRSENQKIRVIHLKHLIRNIHPLKDVLALFEIKRLIETEQPDIIHLNSSKAGFLGSLAGWWAGNKRIIFTAHGLAFLEPKSWIVKQIYFWAEKFATSFRQKVITVSEFDRREAIKSKLGSPEKFITIHNGIEQFETLPRGEARAFLNSKFEIRNSRLIIGTIAHNYKTKDLRTLRQAFTILQKEMSLRGQSPKQSPGDRHDPAGAGSRDDGDLILMIIGRGSRIGEVAEARKYLKAFDVYVSSSVKEGFPYTILEAAAAGLPIVSTKVGGVSEIVTDRESALLVPAKDPQILASAIKRLITDPQLAKMLGENGKGRAKKFTTQQMIAKTLAVYRSLKT